MAINDDVRAPVQSFLHEEENLAHDKWEENVPEWLAQLAPNLPAEEAVAAAKEWAQCAHDLKRRTRTFVRNAWVGLPCRVLASARFPPSKGNPATMLLDEDATCLVVSEQAQAPNAPGREYRCSLVDIRNIWLCADSALARRWHGVLGGGAADADLSCLALLDMPAGPLGVVLRSSEAREEFLDCIAVLIATQRLRSEPGLARCELPGGLPPPEAQLRPPGRSLQSVHLSGPICPWLAAVAEDLLVPEVDDGRIAAVEEGILHLPAVGGAPEASTGGTMDAAAPDTDGPRWGTDGTVGRARAGEATRGKADEAAGLAPPQLTESVSAL